MRVLAAFWEWVTLMGSDWMGRISGGGSVVAAFAALYLKWVADNPKPALWIVAGVCFFIASFWVWYKDQPQLRTDSQGALLESKDETYLIVNLRLRNTHPADNSVDGYSALVRNRNTTYQGISVPIGDLLLRQQGESEPIGFYDLAASPKVLRRGDPVSGSIRFKFLGAAVQDIAGQEFVICFTDFYGKIHKVKGKVPNGLSRSLISPQALEDEARLDAARQKAVLTAAHTPIIKRLMEFYEVGETLYQDVRNSNLSAGTNEKIDKWEGAVAAYIKDAVGNDEYRTFGKMEQLPTAPSGKRIKVTSTELAAMLSAELERRKRLCLNRITMKLNRLDDLIKRLNATGSVGH